MIEPKIKTKWIEALRSGKYVQCKGKLTDNSGYCCLGVLAHIQNANFIDYFEDLETVELHGGEEGYSTEYDFSADLSDPICVTLANMNDGRDGSESRSFDHIAEYLQARDDI
jgi:hypothetical protein